MKTPTTRTGLTQYDHLPPLLAAIEAWHKDGTNPHWHHSAQHRVRHLAPTLATELESLDLPDLSGLTPTWINLGWITRHRIHKAMPLLARALTRLAKQR